MLNNTLFVIPARGGSKGIPRKNIKPFCGTPLIYYSIDYARLFTSDENICVTTDDDEIIQVVNNYNLDVPFIRPANLAMDTSGTYEVLLHALAYYEMIGRAFNKIVLLQPTSPLRNFNHLVEMEKVYSSNIDMVVSVSESKANPYYNLFEENEFGYLIKSKPGNFLRRQDCPKVYEQNGSIYLINVASLKSKTFDEFEKIKKIIMEPVFSIDIDTSFDWDLAESILKNKK